MSEEVPGSQQNDPYLEPPRDQIPGLSKMHVQLLESSGDEKMWVAAGMRHVVLRTVGRRTGNEHKVALPYWRDGDGHRVVVASFAGAPSHPSWFRNLSDRAANPEVHVRAYEGAYWSVPEILDGDEYASIWAQLVADRPFYANYQTRTDRRIPLVRLP